MGEDEVRERLNRVDNLIDAGKWSDAFALAEMNVRNSTLIKKARAWFQHAFIAGLYGDNVERVRSWVEAKRRGDYTHVLEGDFYLREAIELLKRGRVEDAQLARELADELHDGGRRQRDCCSFC